MSLINNSQVVDRTEAFERFPRKPGLIGALGLYSDRNSGTDAVTFDVRENSFHILNDHLRNVSQRNAMEAREYNIHTLAIPHYPVSGVITRQQLAGIKGFGREAEDTVNRAIADELSVQAERHDVHEEYLKAAMTINGQIVTTNYGTINMATEFSVTRPDVEFAANGSDVLERIREAQQAAKNGLTNGGRIQGYVALVGSDLFELMLQSQDVATAYQFSQASGNPLRNELGTIANGYSLFRFGNLDVVLYDDSFTTNTGGNIQLLADDEGVLIPRTVLGRTFFGPASTLSGLGRPGSRRFAQTNRDPKDRYIEVDTEQNTLVINEQFGATVELTIAS